MRPTARNVEQVVPFFRVSNLEASLRYYVDGLGFEVLHRWEEEGTLRWCWLQLGGAALMLQEPARPEAGASLGNGVSLCFQCVDALAVYREVTARGVKAERPFVGNGMWVTTLRDPDGYKLDFESPTEVAEDTVYSDETG